MNEVTMAKPGAYCSSHPKYPSVPVYTARKFFHELNRGATHQAAEHLCWLWGERWRELSTGQRAEVLLNLIRIIEASPKVYLE